MALIGIDLGGTKLALAIFTEEGKIIFKETVALEDRKGTEVGKLITDKIIKFIHYAELQGNHINSIGISVPGISHNTPEQYGLQIFRVGVITHYFRSKKSKWQYTCNN